MGFDLVVTLIPRAITIPRATEQQQQQQQKYRIINSIFFIEQNKTTLMIDLCLSLPLNMLIRLTQNNDNN